jgi:hypothetical protein
MAAHGHHRGHPMTYDEDAQIWRYDDDGTPVPDDPDRRCAHCNLPNREDGHDACLGHIEGVMNACCGHGRTDEAYVQWEPERDGGVHAMEWFRALSIGPRGEGEP